MNIFLKVRGKHKEFLETNTTFEDVSNVTETKSQTNWSQGCEDVLKESNRQTCHSKLDDGNWSYVSAIDNGKELCKLPYEPHTSSTY